MRKLLFSLLIVLLFAIPAHADCTLTPNFSLCTRTDTTLFARTDENLVMNTVDGLGANLTSAGLPKAGTITQAMLAAGVGGSGTVNSGTINQLAYYAATGTAVSGETLFQAANHPALVGDVTTPSGSLTTTVVNFGPTKKCAVVGDGTTDDTTTFQNCVTNAAVGTEVLLPAGIIRITGPILMKEGVFVRGVGFGWDETADVYVKSGWNSGSSKGDPTLLVQRGTIIAIDYVAADTNIPTFKMVTTSGLSGLVFDEWNQNPTSVTPTTYQPVIGNYTATSTNPTGTANINNITLRDLYFINNYFAVKCLRCARVEFQNIHGNPLFTGILLDGGTDVNRVTGIFFSVRWFEANADSPNFNIFKWLSANRVGLDIGRSDEIKVMDFFTLGGKIGIRFFNGAIVGATGGPDGRFANISLDTVQTGVRIDKAGAGTTTFTNWDTYAGTFKGTDPDTDTCWSFTNNESLTFAIGPGACRGASGHAIDYSPTNAANDDTHLQITGVLLQSWGRGGTTGKAGIHLGSTNAQGGVTITGNILDGGRLTNATYGILIDTSVPRAVITGNEFNDTNQTGQVCFSTNQIDWQLTGNYFFNCTKAVNSSITDKFTLTNNLVQNVATASTATCLTNCSVIGNAGDSGLINNVSIGNFQLGIAATNSGTLSLANGAGGGALWTLASGATSAWTLTSEATAPAQGDLFTFSNATGQMASVVDVATGSVLVSGGVGAVPTYSATPSLTSLTLSQGSNQPLTVKNTITGPAIAGWFEDTDSGAATSEVRVVLAEGGAWYQGISGKFNSTVPFMAFSVNTVANTWAEKMRLQSGLQLGAPTGGDKGTGTLNVATGIYTPFLRPAADSTTAVQIQNAAGTAILTVDTTNKRVGIGLTPGSAFEVAGNGTGSVKFGDPGFVNYGGFSMNGTLNATSYSFLSGPSDTTLYINRPTGSDILFRENNSNPSQVAIKATTGAMGIGMNTPSAGNLLQVAGHIADSGTAPAVSSGCGVSPGAPVGADNGFSLAMGTGAITACIVNFATTWASNPKCVCQDNTTAISTRVSAVSTTQVTCASAAFVASDTITVLCMGAS